MTVIIHHANCPDGFTAAWLLKGAIDEPTRLVAANWGDEPPHIVDGEEVYVVDFCYETHHLVDLIQDSGKLVILDHHETSLGWLIEAFGRDAIVTDTSQVASPLGTDLDGDWLVCERERSGATLAAWYIGEQAPPPFVKYVEDRDLWRWKLAGTAEVFAAVTSRPYTIEAYDDLASMFDDQLVGEGRAIDRYREQIIEQTLATAWQATVLGHSDIWVAASPYAIGSDVAARLAERDPDRFAAYFVQYGDRRKYGLRSTERGMNVAAIAETVGGGGHMHAAGFEAAVDG